MIARIPGEFLHRHRFAISGLIREIGPEPPTRTNFRIDRIVRGIFVAPVERPD